MTKFNEANYTMLAPGFAKWWGSDGRALAQAFRSLGLNLIEIDEEDYLPWRWEGFVPKATRRLLSPVWIKNYNEAVLRQASCSLYDFVLVFKGNLLKPETLRVLTNSGKPVFNFYPDTNFLDYGNNIPAALRLYDCVFTTKSFHGEREIQEFGIKQIIHVRHGFDPEVHRPIPLSNEQRTYYGSDVSFVGYWSPENEGRILYLLQSSHGLCIKVFGLGWNHACREFKARMSDNLRPGAFGDELSIVYCASKLNLGLLRRATCDRNTSDQVTARTFQVPATKSLLLHEDTPEVRNFFEDGTEVLLFNNNEEMIERITFALNSPKVREAICRGGYERCQRERYDYISAARTIISHFEMLKRRQNNPDSVRINLVTSKGTAGESTLVRK